MVIELLDYPVSPGFGWWDEPEIDPREQAEADKRPHSSWVNGTSEEGDFIVYLKILGDAHALPDRVNGVQNALR